jgi:hypothetical protein
LATSLLRITTSIFFQLNTCGHSPYVTSSLMRGWVCRLQLLLGLASAVILRFESRGTHDHILLSQIRDSQTWRARSPYLYPQVQGGPVIPPGTGFPFRRLLRLTASNSLRYVAPARTAQKTFLPLLRVLSLSGEQMCPQNCSLATAVVLSPIHTAVTWQWVYIYINSMASVRKRTIPTD